MLDAAMPTSLPRFELVAVAELGVRLESLRLRSPEALSQMQRSLDQQGQLTPIVAHLADAGLEVVDGFKRIHAARALRLAELRVQTLLIERTQAKAAIEALNRGRGLDELEQAWVVRSLYREDGLTQPAIGALLRRDKSWVCRRLALAEGLAPELEADLRLGLFSPSIARELVRLPRGNQGVVLEVVLDRGLTVRQVVRLVQDLLMAPDRFVERLAEVARSGSASVSPAPARARSRGPAELLISDASALSRIGGRLQARLHEAPLATLGGSAAEVVSGVLRDLRPVLIALARTLERVTEVKQHVSLDHA